MGRIFNILAATATLLILVTGGGVFWLSQQEIQQTNREATHAIAAGMVTALDNELSLLQRILDGYATLPEVAAAAANNDTAQLTAIESRLKSLLPHVQDAYLLTRSQLDAENRAPQPTLGAGDLQMATATLSEPQPPVVQGESNRRHLAFTTTVKNGDTVVAVLLLGLEPGVVPQIVTRTPIRNGFAALKQGELRLAATGVETEKNAEAETLPVKHSRFTLEFWPNPVDNGLFIAMIVTTIGVPALLASLGILIGYRRIGHHLDEDLGSILKAAKDIMTGKIAGNYPIHIDEIRPIVTTLAQFKHTLDHDPDEQLQAGRSNIIDNFFDTSGMDLSLLHTSFTPHQEPIEEIEPPAAEEPQPPEEVPAEESPIPEFWFSEPRRSDTDETELQQIAAAKEIDDLEFVHDFSFADTPSPFVSQSAGSNIFRAYDIRGVVDIDLTRDVVADIGRAVGSEAKQLNIKCIVIARDGRLSSPGFAEALARGIASTGCDVLDIGLVPTPMLYFVAHHTEGRSGIMVTGSHNPAEYNGLKIVLNGETLHGERIQQLRQRIDRKDFVNDGNGSIEQNSMFTNEYIGIICDDLHIVRPMKVVLDCGNGAAGELGPLLLKTLGCEVIELFCKIDGRFPNHHPDPSKPENLADLIAAVTQHGADVGIAFDGDGDRLGVVDSSGKIIWPDRQMMLFAMDVLAGKPGSEVVYDVKCSKHLGEQILKRGGKPIMWKTGHSLLKAKLKETGAALAGEMSGHIFFNDRWFGFDDALYAAARLIQLLSADTRTSSEVFADFPDSINTPEINVALKEGENTRFVEQLYAAAQFADGKIVNIDGLRVEFADGWGLVRASNTTPSLVLRFEADNQQALARIQNQFKQLMLNIKPGLSLPF